MKDLSLLLLKNSLAAKMKKGLGSFCNGVSSTSTLNQHRTDHDISYAVTPSLLSSYFDDGNFTQSPPSLEDMIMQLELEEEAARKANLNEYGGLRHRMSCVNNSDILRSARNALNQYPRFSLDGRDAMYRSSFRNFGLQAGRYEGGRRSVCCGDRVAGRFRMDGYDLDLERNHGLPPTLAGETVVWCKPGVVAQLMGLEAMPLPISGRHGKGRLKSKIRKENLKRIERHECEKRRLYMGMHACGVGTGRETVGSCSKPNYRVMPPITVEPTKGGMGWRIR
ncbi:uncharacterized protein LOC131252012 [Magnolia sinica]|uniref:uncharacterized protein LOC131252012 n=1 Tax=Magnolia sinica TaxID=86752 RepID=UPI002657AD0C|nr:uncharacterized protein LOC131252012 [Magnolia sinica]